MSSTSRAPSLPPLPGSDGHVHDLAALSSQAPLFVHAIKGGCPVHAEAAEHVARLARAHADRVRVLGLSDLDERSFPRWQERFAAPFPVLFDPGLAALRALGVPSSPWWIRLEGGRVIGSWPGFGREPLAQVAAAMAAVAGNAAPALDFGEAPERTRYG